MKFRPGCVSFLVAALLLAASIPVIESKKAFNPTSFVPQKITSKAISTKLEKSSTPDVSSQIENVRGGALDNNLINCLAGSVVCGLIEQAVKKGLTKANISFPSSLGGCIFLFFFLVLADIINPTVASSMYEALAPAAAFLAKWMAPLFVPGLVMLPLSPSVGGGMEILKVIATVAIGFVFTITTSAFSVLTIRKAQGTLITTSTVPSKAVASGPKPKPFNEASWSFFSKGALLSAVATVWASKTNNAFASPIQTLFLTFLTVAAYIWSANLPAGFVKIVHPLATSATLVLTVIRGLAAITGREYYDVLRSYKVGSLDPMKAGAGDILMFLLGAPVVGFAISVYSRRQLLFNNLVVVLTSVLVGSAGSLFATAGFVRLISLGSGATARLVRLSLLARNVTTALAIALTNMLGGDISIAASVVCLTGILGGTYGQAFMDALGIKDPICRGIGMGCSSQGLGVAAISGEPDAFPFAAIAMVLTAIAATTLASIPAVKEALIQTACG
ncbi:hypothetical protein FisN_5Hh182 [Fistulifera solaris]|uniref:Uncharacterized protein n=1 Tax=Fistulifera solaris TaxID=1519565 RepID=A0A1Z5JS09_FISSO|nr:hypothetical protein FisN_5Hh182 [Fistulifera solaris]|eukprot:GAX16810.1 hypothetical protein FisN_5Hh182 [Fistulifera solaris]